MRTNLKVFRVQQGLTQKGMADEIGCSRASYACIENGMRSGRHKFWHNLQSAFQIPDASMYALTLKDDER